MNPEKQEKKQTSHSSGISPVPLEIYIHVPFCVKKCAYCDFLSFSADEKIQDIYFEALLAEIGAWKGGFPDSREVTSIFIGGGTPSVPDAAWIVRALDKIKESFAVSPEAEVSMEANPGTLTREKLKSYYGSGINRLSLGLQSADNRELKQLGRIHTWETFLESFRLAREEGFSNINVDLISAIPDQTRESWQRTLRQVAGLSPEHISAYSLIIEEGTPFAERELNLPDEDTEYEMYEDTAEILSAYGYQQYEISNYAKPGFACRHNIGYWKRREYLGLGLGAASFREALPGETTGFLRYSNTRILNEYLRDSAYPGKLQRENQVLSKKEMMEEFLFLGLRMTAGISEKEYEKQFGEPISLRYGSFLEKYEASGHLRQYTVRHPGPFAEEEAETCWCFTRKGIHVSNWILADVLN